MLKDLTYLLLISFLISFLSVVVLQNLNSVVFAQTPRGGNIEITNPLKWNTFSELIEAIIEGLITLSFAIVPLVIVVAGYLFVTAGGDPQKVSQAKNMIIYTLIGLVIILMAKGIIVFVETAIGVNK